MMRNIYNIESRDNIEETGFLISGVRGGDYFTSRVSMARASIVRTRRRMPCLPSTYDASRLIFTLASAAQALLQKYRSHILSYNTSPCLWPLVKQVRFYSSLILYAMLEPSMLSAFHFSLYLQKS